MDAEEAQYQASLLPIAEAMEKLAASSSVMVDVVRRGWEGILLRKAIEEEVHKSKDGTEEANG